MPTPACFHKSKTAVFAKGNNVNVIDGFRFETRYSLRVNTAGSKYDEASILVQDFAKNQNICII